MVRRRGHSLYRFLQDTAEAAFLYSRRLTEAYVEFVGRLADAYVVLVAGVVALVIGNLTETPGASMMLRVGAPIRVLRQRATHFPSPPLLSLLDR